MSNQIRPISTSHRRGMRTTRPIILMIILPVWIGLPAAALPPPDSLTTRKGDSARGAGQSGEQELSLELGKPIERELSGAQSHFYKITMTSGQYLRITVSQRGIDALVALFTPNGKKIGEVNSEQAAVGVETISAIADAAGAYRIEARSAEKTAKTGRYEIKVEALREATAEDKYRVAAEALFREADLLGEGTLEEKRKGIEKYQEALDLYRRAGARREEAETLHHIGAVYRSLGEMQKALDKYNEALPIRRAIGDRSGEAITLNNIGLVHWSLGETQKALEKYNESLPIRRAIGDRSGEAVTLNNIALAYWSLGEMRKALDKCNEALPIARAIGNRTTEATLYGIIGAAYQSLGETQKSMDKLNEALLILQAIGDRNGEATTLHNIGFVYESSGEMRKALDKYNEALLIKRAIGERMGEAATLNNIGAVYRSLGEMRKALDKFNEALPIRRAVGDRTGEAITINNIGLVYQSLGEAQKALEKYNEALPISQAISARSIEGRTLHNIGAAYNSLGEAQKALDKFNEALSISRAIGARNEEAQTLLRIAQVEQKRGNLTLARQSLEQAINIVESIRANISGQGLRVSFFASRQEFYQSYIDLLMRMQRQNPNSAFDSLALEVSERARARSLLELLTESRADLRQGVDISLLERERSLRRLLNAKATAQVALLSRKHTPAQAEAAAKEIDSITAEYEELRAQIRESSPRYDALTQPQPLSLAEIQRRLLDQDTLLLEYSLGDDASYLFVVSQTSITSHQLPKRAEVEAATRRVRELLTAPQPQPGDTEAKYQARIKEAKENYWPQAAELSRMLLGPAASQLGGKRLLIVADGALQYLPFGALPAPETERRRDGETRRQGDKETRRQGKSPLPTPHSPLPTPLIVNNEIVHLPSASTLAVLRRELAGRRPAAKTVAVLADPVFSADDARVKSGAKTQADEEAPTEEAPADLTRAINDVRGDMRRLLLTRDEAEAILSVTPRTNGFGALDFRANRATATSDELSRYRIVHFATHGLLNSEHPELSGVVLSLVDERGQPQDGFLRLHEIFNLRLPAELVVLSACQTGLGKEIKGEGLVGLTRGFMYAGAARVVASLWQVNDAATAELMKRFYRRMLKEGMRPAAALRAAQIEMWKRPQWQSPFYWGGFVLQGEWK
jgi:CHAT domain-containing protein/predicted negative regulator of RcsB-dependent stress response